MDAQKNKELLEEIFSRMAKGEVQAMSEAMADDFRWTFPGTWSWAGTREPKQAALDHLLRPLMAQFAAYRSEAHLIIAEHDRVVVQAKAHATTTNGDDYPQTYCYIFRLKNSKITEVTEYCDTALAERVLTRPPT
ncbi:nuclear transport factor 2 family protein [Spirillospora sp. CA-294931]|uniref:nuclear transport factor 2 family protein n=1 Tax=Spirillospora sp. CA-294931 TaxID=3240042 RepID=UPI003D8FC2A4